MANYTLNINCEVLIKLNKRGHDAFVDFYEHLGLDPELYRRHAKQPDGRYKFSLWEVMHIFGSACYMGPEPAFEMTIEIINDQGLLQAIKHSDIAPNGMPYNRGESYCGECMKPAANCDCGEFE